MAAGPKKLKGADPALQQQAEFAVVRLMKLRYGGTMTFDPCTWCGHWAVTSLGHGKMHPTCVADPERLRQVSLETRRAKKAPDSNQGAMAI